MATFREVAREYADRIRTAASQDRLRSGLRTRASLTESVAKRFVLASELKSINREIDLLLVDGRSMRPEVRRRIATLIGEELGIQRPWGFDSVLREASNDAFGDLLDVIWDLLQGGKR